MAHNQKNNLRCASDQNFNHVWQVLTNYCPMGYRLTFLIGSRANEHRKKCIWSASYEEVVPGMTSLKNGADLIASYNPGCGSAIVRGQCFIPNPGILIRWKHEPCQCHSVFEDDRTLFPATEQRIAIILPEHGPNNFVDLMKVETAKYNITVVDISKQQDVIKNIIELQTTTLILAVEAGMLEEKKNVETHEYIIVAFTIDTKLVIVIGKEAYSSESALNEDSHNETIREVSSTIIPHNTGANIIAKALVSVVNYFEDY